MRNALRGAGSLAAVLAIAAVLVVGSQAIRQSPKAALISPSPSAAPVAGPLCISPDATQCSSPAPTACVGGEGTVCSTDLVPSAAQPTPTTAPPPDTSAGTVAPAGSIQASAVSFSTGEKVGVTVAVLSGGSWVSGASVTVHCFGSSWDANASGITAPVATWPVPANGPRPPDRPATFFWTQLSGPGSGKTYSCDVTAAYSGLTTAVSFGGTA